ncbi:MAG TPA: maltodextrin glucosidase [Chloroflexia bacterium]|nr:maltodextrin glucosidase [Chloroflexia bacterium]
MLLPDWAASIHHDGSPLYTIPDATAFEPGAEVTLRLRTGLNAPVEKVFLRTSPDGEQRVVPAEFAGKDAACNWWEVRLKLEMPLMHYRFLLLTAEGGYWFNAAGVTRHDQPDAGDFKLLAGYQAPEWVRQSVFYQIFPDRFADGDPSNNVRTGEYSRYGRPVVAREWGALPSKGFEASFEFFGGDLQGVLQKLDYLQELGVTALYLNPVFTSPSNHKYDVTDYYQVDPHMGGDEALVRLREACSERGMRLMLDIVPNHSSDTHPWFTAAQSNTEAETNEFYTFRQHPNEYESWLGVGSLPKLNYRSLKLRQKMYEGEQSIMRYWLRPPFSIDGWRLDVANMMGRQGESQLGHKIGRGMRRAIKSEKAEAYILGENFFDGTPQLQGDELDATMNYMGFIKPLWRWLAAFELGQLRNAPQADYTPLPTEALAAQWQAFRAAVPWQIALQQFNQLSSHDVPRIFTVVKGDEQKARVAITLLFSYPGVPCVYYGDEIGLEGGADPDNRRCMEWEPQRWHTDLRAFYLKLIELRKSSPALIEGGYQQVYASGDTLAFVREAPGDRLLVVIRRADDGLEALPVRHANLPDGSRLHDLLSGQELAVENGVISLNGLGATGAQIWRMA